LIIIQSESLARRRGANI